MSTEFLAMVKGMFILDGAVPDPAQRTGRQQQYSVRMPPDENITLPGVISHIDAIPCFIHYEEQVFVEVKGGFSIRGKGHRDSI